MLGLLECLISILVVYLVDRGLALTPVEFDFPAFSFDNDFSAEILDAECQAVAVCHRSPSGEGAVISPMHQRDAFELGHYPPCPKPYRRECRKP
jgi:hypothetical protein